MSSKNIIILDGSGAIDSSIAKELKQRNYTSTLISKKKEKTTQENLLKINDSILLFSSIAVQQGFINHSIYLNS